MLTSNNNKKEVCLFQNIHSLIMHNINTEITGILSGPTTPLYQSRRAQCDVSLYIQAVKSGTILQPSANTEICKNLQLHK